MIVQTLRVVGDLVENVLDEVTQTKKLCYDCVREYLEDALWLFPLYVNVPAVCGELFDFFHTVFDVLKAQMGASNVEAAIQIFLSLFDKDLIAKVITDESFGVRVIERFLGILEFVVKEPSSSFRKFIPSTLQLVLQHIYPLVANVNMVSISPRDGHKSEIFAMSFTRNRRRTSSPPCIPCCPACSCTTSATSSSRQWSALLEIPRSKRR